MKITPSLIETHWPLSRVRMGNVLQQSRGRIIGILHSSEGEFIYKLAGEGKTNATLDEELRIFDFLPEHDFFHIPKLIKTREGGRYHCEEERCLYILEYIEGKQPEPTVEIYEKLGAIMARLHTIGGYPYQTKFDASIIIRRDLPQRAKNLPFQEEYLKLVSALPYFNTFPQALIHTDPGMANIIERPDGDLVLIDWDDAGTGPAILDIGFPLIQHFITEECAFLNNNAKAFYKTYFSHRTITTEEKKHIFDASLFVALDYIIYGDISKRWKRIQWALEHRNEVEDTIFA